MSGRGFHLHRKWKKAFCREGADGVPLKRKDVLCGELDRELVGGDGVLRHWGTSRDSWRYDHLHANILPLSSRPLRDHKHR